MEILNNQEMNTTLDNQKTQVTEMHTHLVNQTATLADQKRQITQLETILRNQENTLVNQKTEITQMSDQEFISGQNLKWNQSYTTLRCHLN